MTWREGGIRGGREGGGRKTDQEGISFEVEWMATTTTTNLAIGTLDVTQKGTSAFLQASTPDLS